MNTKKHVGTSNALRRFLISRQSQQFIENLAMLLAAGIDMLTSLKTLSQETRSKALTSLIQELRASIESGVSISDAMANTAAFPSGAISLIRLGELSGQVPEHMRIVASQQEREGVLKGKVRAALLYVSIVLSLTLVVGLGVAWYVLPTMAQVFSGFNAKLPLLTRVMLYVGQFLADHGSWFMPLVLVLFFGSWFVLFIWSATKHIGQSLLLKIPGVGQWLKDIEISRFSHVLGTMLQVGISPPEAIRSLDENSSLRIYRRFYRHLYSDMIEGKSFQQSFSSYKGVNKLFPLVVQQMLFASEQSGNLAESLIIISQRFEAKADEGGKNMTVLIEPLLLIVVGIVVGLLALAIFMPIYDFSAIS